MHTKAKFAVVLSSLFGICLLAMPSYAAVIVDQNSVVGFNVLTATQTSWFVDVTSQLASQQFFYNNNDGTGVHNISTLNGTITVTPVGTDQLNVEYFKAGVADVKLSLKIIGDVAGSGFSHLNVTFTGDSLNLINGNPAPLQLYEFANFDLNNSSADDLLQFTNSALIKQKDASGLTTVTENTSIAEFQKWLGGDNSTSAIINATTGDSLALGPPALGDPFTLYTDTAWAVEWLGTVTNPNHPNHVSISKDEIINGGAVGLNAPEPGSLLVWSFLGLTVCGVAVIRRRS